MTRPTRLHIDDTALLHNVRRIRQCAPGKKIIAMVKANAYGCGLPSVVPVLDGQVDAFGVACLEEAITLRRLGGRGDCILFQGVFEPEEWKLATSLNLQCVIHQLRQLEWLLSIPLPTPMKVWVKVNSGMNRLGFDSSEVYDVISALFNCPWVDKDIGLMTHLACADDPEHKMNQMQLTQFNSLVLPEVKLTRSIANSAAILSLDDSHADVVRPGIMLFGVSPFPDKESKDLALRPVMRFVSAISAIHHCPSHAYVGYGSAWSSDKPSIIGVVPVGYGDGYPRHLAPQTPTWVNGFIAPVVGRVSMDMLTINLTDCPGVKAGDAVELWGPHIPIETIAKAAGTIPYELMSQLSSRVR